MWIQLGRSLVDSTKVTAFFLSDDSIKVTLCEEGYTPVVSIDDEEEGQALFDNLEQMLESQLSVDSSWMRFGWCLLNLTEIAHFMCIPPGERGEYRLVAFDRRDELIPVCDYETQQERDEAFEELQEKLGPRKLTL